MKKLAAALLTALTIWSLPAFAVPTGDPNLQPWVNKRYGVMQGLLKLVGASNGSEPATCSATTAGALIYSTTGSSIRYCNGSSWGDVGGGALTGSGAANRIATWSGASALTSASTFTYDGNSQTITRTSIGASYSTPGLAILNTTTGSEQHSPSIRLGGYATSTQEDWYITNAANTSIGGPNLAFVSATSGSASSVRTNLQEISSVVYFGTSTNHTFRLMHANTQLISLQNDGVRNQVLFGGATVYMSASGASSYPGFYAYGAPFTGGSSTSTKPYMLFEPNAVATSNNWPTTGTFIGVNAASGWAGNFIDLQTEAVRKFSVSSSGAVTSSSLTLAAAGDGILIKEGTNATMGTATLSGGTIVVNTTKVTANSRIFLTVNGGTLTNVGSTYVSARTAGTSFTITSSNVLDASNVAWVILEPAP